MTKTLPEEWHGKVGGYTNEGCREECCRAAWAQYMAVFKERRAAALAADPSLAPHGRYSTYTNWKCRCADCRESAREYAASRKVSA